MNFSFFQQISKLSVLVVIFLFLIGCDKPQKNTAQESVQRQKIDESHSTGLKPFLLTDHQGNSFNNKRLFGHWSFIFIGYTSCPDICPTTLMELNYAYPELKQITEQSGQTAQVVFVTADPMRDSQEKIAAYLNYFNNDFIAVRSNHENLFPFVRELGLIYSVVDEVREDYYLVDHSASIAIVNPEGELATLVKPEKNPDGILSVSSDKLISEFKTLLKSQ